MSVIRKNIHKWLLDNQEFFQPPICNKLMYKDGQLKAFFVGGPNSRKDFHLEAGEEFFYMLKGDMNLVAFERGKFKDIIIKEGEVFLLPGRIPHSPQRVANTIGLVIERERGPKEIDCLRYYVDGSNEILYEKWFHCDSLDSQLPPLIKEFFTSEQYKTGRPVPGTILDEKPLIQDNGRQTEKPFSLNEWTQKHRTEINTRGRKSLFEDTYSSRIFVLGMGEHTVDRDLPETFLWQLENNSSVIIGDEKYELEKNDTMLLQSGDRWVLKNETGGMTLSVVMNPLPEN